nr:serine/threonine-protein kinase [Mycolicibacter kumamotonensis]
MGHGVVGEVYRAEDTRNDEMVALKLISESFSGDEAFRSRLEDEAEAAGQLTEPHVVSVRAYGEIDDVLYLETDLIGGTDLAALLADGGPLSPPRAVAIVRQIAAALDAAHNADVIHRDVKPDNILVTADDLAYLMDFGVAAAIADPATRADPATGTVRYMAPERLTGEQVTHLADIYSLACVLAECLGGVPPFSADTVDDARSKNAGRRRRRDPASCARDASRWLSTRCWRAGWPLNPRTATAAPVNWPRPPTRR